MGASAFVTQVTLMREMLGALAGNELVLGIVLGAWMLLMGLGAVLGRAQPAWIDAAAALVVGLMAVAVLPVLDVIALRTLWNSVFVRGAAPGAWEAALVSATLLAPYCLAAGAMLTWACRLMPGQDAIGRVYLLDSLGGIVGGIAFSAVLVWWLDSFQILYVPAFLCLGAGGLVAWRHARPVVGVFSAVGAIGLLVVAIGVDLDAWSTAAQYAPQEVCRRGQSAYGRLVVTRLRSQYSFWENGVRLFSTDQPAEAEETAHIAMAQRPDAKRVLLISGGVAGIAREVLKYPVEAVDYVELDPQVLDAARSLLPDVLADPRMRVIQTDGRSFLQRSAAEPDVSRYDVILLNVPEPSTLQLNRFFTREFFVEVRARLQPHGVLSFPLGGYNDYLSPEQVRILASTRRTLAEAFEHVLALPGSRIFFLASNGGLTADIADRIEAAKVPVDVMKREYLGAMLTRERLADVERAVETEAPINFDFSPTLYFDHLVRWLKQYEVRCGWVEIAIAFAMVVYLIRIRSVALIVFSGGFAAAALEVLFLLGFQTLFGSTYVQMSLIVATFMAGLTLGAFLAHRYSERLGRLSLIGAQLAIGWLAALTPFLFAGLARLSAGSSLASWTAWTLVPLATLLLATLVGMQFPIAARADFHSARVTASRLYAADYLGGALGALLVSAWLIPVLGVLGVADLVGAVCLFSVVPLFVFR